MHDTKDKGKKGKKQRKSSKDKDKLGEKEPKSEKQHKKQKGYENV